jgi:hypothetical protein
MQTRAIRVLLTAAIAAALAREAARLPPLEDDAVEPRWRGQSHVVWLHGGGLQHPTHPGIYQDTLADMDAIRWNPARPNPLLYGRERASRYWTMVVECARARVVALDDR